MRLVKESLLAQFALLHFVSGFVVPTPPISLQAHHTDGSLCMSFLDEDIDRRSLLNIGGAISVAALFAPITAFAEEVSGGGKTKVVVMGGAGYVGSRVSAALYDKGFDVVSVSRSSPADQAARIKANVGKSPSIQYESLDATKDDLSGVMKDAAVVVSCLGVPPWEKATAREGNGLAHQRIADAAKAAGVGKFVYVSVASEFAKGPGKFLFGEYFKGKAEADAAISRDFGDNAILVMPGILDGAPPGELRPPPPPGLAISPDAVANAAVAGVLGKVSGKVDGYNAIMAVAAQ